MDPDVHVLDAEILAKELRVEPEAKALGERGHPCSDQTALTGTERAIIQRVERAQQDYMTWAARRLQVINEDFAKRDVNLGSKIEGLLHAPASFSSKADQLIAESRPLLMRLQEASSQRQRELEHFRLANRLDRAPNYPTGWGVFMRFAVLILLIVVEAMLNATFFAKGLSTGLVGGFFYAAFLALINVLIAFLIGRYLIGYVLHVASWKRAFGIASIGVALSIAGFMGITIAHFRDALAMDVDNAPRIAMEHIFSNPLQLADINSWLLFGVSIACAMFALIDGLSLDDWYPGFGRLARRALYSKEEFDVEITEVRARLEKLKDAELQQLDTIADRLEAVIALMKESVEQKRATEKRVALAMTDAENCMKTLISRFRDLNRLHRPIGQPAPAYFNEYPPLNTPTPLDFDVEREERALAAKLEDVGAAIGQITNLKSKIQSSLSEHFDLLSPLQSHFAARINPSPEAA